MKTLQQASTTELARELARRAMREKTCPRPSCGRVFTGYPNQRWCSRQCADAAYYQKHKAERNAARTLARRSGTQAPKETTP